MFAARCSNPLFVFVASDTFVLANHRNPHGEVAALAQRGIKEVKGKGFGLLLGIDRLTVMVVHLTIEEGFSTCLLYTSPSPRDATLTRMPSSA